MGAMELPLKKSKDGMTLQVRVKPRSSGKGIERVEGDTVFVRLSSPPAEGKANTELIAIISKALGVGKSSISIMKGKASRDKVLLIRT